MPEPARLLVQRGDQRRMRVTQRVDGEPGGKVEHPPAVVGFEPGALTANECDRCTGERLIECRIAHSITTKWEEPVKKPKSAAGRAARGYVYQGARGTSQSVDHVQVDWDAVGGFWGKRG